MMIRARLSEAAAALALLTRLPAPFADHSAGHRAAWAWPLAGAAVGLIAAAAAEAGRAMGLPDGASGALALTAAALVTGGLHHDGLADMADGVGGGRDPARRLEIMRDSRVGSYGVLALVLVSLLAWSALTALLAAGSVWLPLVAAAMASRAAMAGVAAGLPFARTDGLARLTGRPAPTLALAAGGLAALAALSLGAAALAALALVTATAALVVARIAARRLGGQTGDVLGAAQQTAEAAGLLALAAVL
jgi:adenosylcobinamide-GDP ribazoletransferase